MATVQEIYNEIDRIESAKSGIAGAIEEKGVEVPAGAKIEAYPGLVRQIQQGDTSDCVKFTPQTLTEEQKAQARENIGAGATVITVSPVDSLVITLPKSAQGIKGSYRIDMTAAVYGGEDDTRYLGSLIIECNELAMQTAHGYYYGDDMAEILSEVAIWKDDPEIYPDEQRYFLLLTTDSNLDEVIFSVSSLDGQSVDADASNEDEKVKIADANISPVGSGGGDGKMGVISQTQTWPPSGSNPRTYVMSDQVLGVIPQANIDLFEAAGAVFNESTGYFEIGTIADLSYKEMADVYLRSIGLVPIQSRSQTMAQYAARTTLVLSVTTSFPNNGSNMLYASEAEEINFSGTFYQGNSASNANGMFNNSTKLRKINGIIRNGGTGTVTNCFYHCYSLEEIRWFQLSANISFGDSSNLSKDSLLYMINNSLSTAFTITLHASVYAKCQSGGEWYSDISTALAAHTNVTLASA